MGYCSIHEKTYEGHCNECLRLYREDMAAIPPRIPPQFLAAGVKFEFEDWREIREAEQDAAIRVICATKYKQAETDEQRQAMVNEACKKRAADVIQGRLICHKMQQEAASRSPAQVRSEQDAKIRGRYTY